MSTAAPEKPKEEKKVDKLVQCPRCEAIFHESELITPRHDEYPRVVFKPHPKEDPKDKAAEPEPPPDTKTVANEEELKKAESEGWSKDPPKPKDAKHDPTKAPEGNAKADPHKPK